MTDQPAVTDNEAFQQTAETACERLSDGQRVSRSLPSGGHLMVDRLLPFLFVYRFASDQPDVGARELLASEASYLIAPADQRYHSGVVTLCHRVEALMHERYRRFLRIEIWSAANGQGATAEEKPLPLMQPSFTVVCQQGEEESVAVQTLTQALGRIKISGHTAHVEVAVADQISPPGVTPIPDSDGAGGAALLGIAIRPIYRDADTQTLFPMVLRRFRSQLATALRKTVAKYAGQKSPDEAPHFHSYGTRTLVKSLRRVDNQLCDVAESFDFLLQATPTNSDDAWDRFQQDDFEREPAFTYRPLPYDPISLKRALFAVETDTVADPSLSYLFREKQVELDRQISALRDLNTPSFRYACFQLYGGVDDPLMQLATEMLDRIEPPEDSCSDPVVEVDTAVRRAREEIAYYRARTPDFDAEVRADADLPAGVMVSGGALLISRNARIRSQRLVPLLHHEVGTHLLTHFNGRQQPLRLLSAGLAGYEELQEGLAVLLEHLAGGLTAARLRTLAGRVVAVRLMSDGRPFTHTFDRLRSRYGFPARTAFLMTLRVYRGGGISKDAIYLRGLRDVLGFLADDGAVEPLFAGKLAIGHLSHLAELRRRGIVKPPNTLPRLWDDPETHVRLQACRGRTVLELLEMDR